MDREAMTPFLNACGMGGPLRLKVEERARPGASVRLIEQPFILIGRGERMDLMLDHWQVSRRHAYLQVVNGRVFCADLGSRLTASWENCGGVPGWLDREHVVQIGPYRIRVEDAPALSGRSRPIDSAQLPAVNLEFSGLEFSGEAAGQSYWSVRDEVTLLGRSPECKLRLIDPDVSKFHSSLIRTPHGLWVVDLVGRSGIAINGRRVHCGWLDEGAELTVARSVIRVRYGVSPETLRSWRLATGGFQVSYAPDRPGPEASAAPNTALPVGPVTSFDRELVRVPLIAAQKHRSSTPPPQPPAVRADDPLALQLLTQFEQMQQQMFSQFNQMIVMMAQAFGAVQREQMESVREELEQLRELSRELQELQLQRDSELARPEHLGITSDKNISDIRSDVPLEPAWDLPGPTAAEPGESPSDVDVHAWLNQRIKAVQEEQQGRWQRIRDLILGR